MNTNCEGMDVFEPFPKIARLSREITITEKIDGTNAQIYITPNGIIYAGSRTRWITPESDNHGFARWVYEHKIDLLTLGPGRHYGEWWGQGINRGYGLKEKRFSLFNVSRYTDLPLYCNIVPTLYIGPFDTKEIERVMEDLRLHGSFAAPGFKDPEGIVIYHTASRVSFKKTIKDDEKPKGEVYCENK